MDEDYAIRHMQNIADGHGLTYNQTSINPVGLAAILLCAVTLLIIKRKYSILPVVIIACFIPAGQRIAIFNFDFTLLRIMIFFGWVRLFVRGELAGFEWKTIDKVVVVWSIASLATYTLLRGSIDALVTKTGGMYDALGLYFLFRMLIRDWDDVKRVAEFIVIVSIPVTIFFLIEFKTGRNMFSTLGGVPDVTVVRGDRMRCQGAFSHPIMAGCFWASLIPLIGALWWSRDKKKILIIVGLINATMIVILCGSSTPAGSFAAGIIALCFFPARYLMQYVRWGVVFMLILLHIVMKAPVWQLIARVDIVGGSTGYHRFMLVDQAIKRFSEWWLLGTTSTAHWGHFLFDVANQYVSEAVRGGLVTLLLFLTIIALAFRGVGTIWRIAGEDKSKVVMAWAMGCSLFIHCVSFIGLHYLGQILVIWYILLASIGSLVPASVKFIQVVKKSHVST